jgi:hypothetical protein
MRVQCVVIQVTLNQWHSTQHIFHLTDVKCRQYCCRSFIQHGNTLPLHAAFLSKTDEFKSAEKNSEYSYVGGETIPFHQWGTQCTYQTSGTTPCNIEISHDIEFCQRFHPEWIWGYETYTILYAADNLYFWILVPKTMTVHVERIAIIASALVFY